MSDLTLILLAAGSSSRFGLDVKKQWLHVEDKPLWYFVAKKFQKSGLFKKIIIVSSKDDVEFMRFFGEFDFVVGGNTRQESLKNGVEKVDSKYVLVSDVARACVSKKLLKRIVSAKEKADCIVPFLNVSDTVVYQNETINRDDVKLIQTPQLSKTKILKKALKNKKQFTDESSAIVAYGGTRHFVKGDKKAHKITFIDDLKKLPCLKKPSQHILSGNGFDVHEFEDGKNLFLGGVEVEAPYTFKAHSDGDVAIHSLIDALLGACGMGDIGMMFPDNDDKFKNIDSKKLLKEVVKKIHNFGFEIINVDVTIIAQKPRLSNYKTLMRKTLAKILHVDVSKVNIKATTTEKLGFIGRSEGVGVLANANLKYIDWNKK